MHDAQQIAHQVEEFRDEPDKLFGVCLAIGEELGFNPFYLRVALIALTVFNPVAAIATYAGLGVLVLVARIVFPKPGSASASAEESKQGEASVEPQLPLAA